VPDRVALSSRRGMVREGSGLSGTSSVAAPASSNDLKACLAEIEPLEGQLSPKEVDEIMQTTAKMVGDNNVEWTKRLNMVRRRLQ